MKITKTAAHRSAVLISVALALVQMVFSCDVSGEPVKDMATNNAFAFQLFANVSHGPSNNVCVSPISVAGALSVLRLGARGNTEREIARALHAEGDSGDGLAGLRLLSRLSDDRRGPVRVKIGHSIWVQRGCELDDAFIQKAANTYGTELFQVDLLGAQEESLKQMNDWVLRQTRGKIRNGVDPGLLLTQTNVIFIDTFYFKGRWGFNFDKARTADAEFVTEDGKTTKVPMMLTATSLNVVERGLCQMVELPYSSNAFSMWILLPKRGHDVREVRGVLEGHDVEQLIQGKKLREVELHLPRFRFETRLQLEAPLRRLGIADAFTEAADFSGMCTNTRLGIAHFVQGACVAVDEEGTEAAAANVVDAQALSQPEVIKADHPFVFFIRENTTGAVVFIGELVLPLEGEKRVRNGNRED